MKQEEGRQAGMKTEEHVKTVQMALWVALILVQMATVNCLETRAAATVQMSAESMPAESMPAEQMPAEQMPAEPGTIRAENGDAGDVAITRREVEKTVEYENLEGAAPIPETLDVDVTEQGQTVRVRCSRQESRITEEHWEADFQFPVVFHSYDADYYVVGEKLIPHRDETPSLTDCEAELLSMIGVSPEEYRIETIEWTGEAYPDESGNPCRDAVAKGSRLLRDYQVRYSGVAQFPAPITPEIVVETEGFSTESTEPETEETKAAEPVAETPPPGVVISETEAEAGEAEIPLTLLQKLTRTMLVAIGIGALMFFGGLLLLMLLRLVKFIRTWYTSNQKPTDIIMARQKGQLKGEKTYVHRK